MPGGEAIGNVEFLIAFVGVGGGGAGDGGESIASDDALIGGVRIGDSLEIGIVTGDTIAVGVLSAGRMDGGAVLIGAGVAGDFHEPVRVGTGEAASLDALDGVSVGRISAAHFGFVGSGVVIGRSGGNLPAVLAGVRIKIAVGEEVASNTIFSRAESVGVVANVEGAGIGIGLIIVGGDVGRRGVGNSFKSEVAINSGRNVDFLLGNRDGVCAERQQCDGKPEQYTRYSDKS